MPIKLKVKLGKVGNSLRITIPMPIIESLNLKEGDILEMSTDNSNIIIAKEKKTK